MKKCCYVLYSTHHSQLKASGVLRDCMLFCSCWIHQHHTFWLFSVYNILYVVCLTFWFGPNSHAIINRAVIKKVTKSKQLSTKTGGGCGPAKSPANTSQTTRVVYSRIVICLIKFIAPERTGCYDPNKHSCTHIHTTRVPSKRSSPTKSERSRVYFIFSRTLWPHSRHCWSVNRKHTKAPHRLHRHRTSSQTWEIHVKSIFATPTTHVQGAHRRLLSTLGQHVRRP